MNKLYLEAEKRLKEKYDVDLLNQLILAREDRAIYYVEYKKNDITYTKIHGDSPLDKISKNNTFHLSTIDSLFDMDSKYAEVAGKDFYKTKNLNIIREMVDESNVTIPIKINGNRHWIRLHSYTTLKNEKGNPILASCFITDVSRYLIGEELLYEKTH